MQFEESRLGFAAFVAYSALDYLVHSFAGRPWVRSSYLRLWHLRFLVVAEARRRVSLRVVVFQVYVVEAGSQACFEAYLQYY